ncbi:MAG: nucleoside-diphosphate kinase [Acidobacteria bacterium]|nr:MAG: nucleoside-diphosphate kinase [Acidobacteriota bacterium]
MEKTFTILKPDTVKAGNIGAIISQLEKEGFRIRAMKMVHLTEAQAQGFYYVHKERPFFGSLVKFMSEGPIVPMVLEADNAIEKLRKVMGATDSKKAEAGTIRKQFGTDIERNAIHGSDGPETAAFEIAYFFSQLEVVG